jgi:hypothetical protein
MLTTPKSAIAVPAPSPKYTNIFEQFTRGALARTGNFCRLGNPEW